MSPFTVDKRLLARMISGAEIGFACDSFTLEEWSQIVSCALEQEVAPLLYWQLVKSGRMHFLSEADSDLLRAIYYSTRMKNEQNIRELDRLMGLFDQVGIQAVALKGICLALTVYPDIGLRPMIDVDLLVPASKILAAAQIMKEIGYTEVEPEALPGLVDLFGGEISLHKTSMPFTMLELHNSLLADKSFSYAVPVEWFWDQLVPIRYTSAGKNLGQLYIFLPEAQLLYLTAHAMLKHGSRNVPLRWFYDLDLLIRHYSAEIDWELVVRQAKVFQWASALHAALVQTFDFFGTPIPEHILYILAEIKDQHHELVHAKRIAPCTRVLEEQQSLMERKWFGKLIVILGLLFPSPAYMRWRYKFGNNWSLPAWYLYRWWGILKDLLHTLSVLIQRTKPAKVQNVESSSR